MIIIHVGHQQNSLMAALCSRKEVAIIPFRKGSMCHQTPTNIMRSAMGKILEVHEGLGLPWRLNRYSSLRLRPMQRSMPDDAVSSVLY